MKAWSYWLPDLMPHVPGCPQVLAEHELRRAAQAFFQQTMAWRVDETPRAVLAGTDEISVAPADADLELVRVDAVWYDGQRLDPIAPETLDAQYHDDWQTQTDTPTKFMQVVPGVIRLYPIPLVDAVTGLRLRLIVTPGETSTGLPDDLARRFRDEIHVGAKSRLMLYPGKPWTNIELAGVYGQAFNALVNQATAAAARAFVQARLPSRANWC
jgi:hypothetical protein